MKKLLPVRLLTLTLTMMASTLLWSQGVTTPRVPSPAATTSQTVGISTVSVEYSRPSVRDRAVWGALVPYGWNVQGFGNQKSAPWRAGANENTVIEFSHNAKVEGKVVPAGRYGLFFTINADNSGEVILSKDTRSWGSFFYEEANGQLRAKIQTREHAMTEMLTFDFINVGKNSAELVLNWEKKQFPVKIEFAADDIVMANASEELKGVTGFNWQGFASAANYALQNEVNQEQAVKWADQAVAQNKNFNTLIVKAGLLEQQGKSAEAEPIKTEAIAIATEAELNAYGYQLVGQGSFDKAIKIFKLNTERHPESPNAWDSLGEGYALKGDKTNAIKNFKKSLSMNPPANVRANSEMYLKKLEGS
jgi:tetratricopeptide (TPR) repeat protein